MKGILFRVIEDVVFEALSADAWDDVIDRSGVSGSYTSLGNYPDILCDALRKPSKGSTTGRWS